MNGTNLHQHHNLHNPAAVHGQHGGEDAGFYSTAGGMPPPGAMGGGGGAGQGGPGQCDNLLSTEFINHLAPWLWYYGVVDWPQEGQGAGRGGG